MHENKFALDSKIAPKLIRLDIVVSHLNAY